jgi:hypothetical protein
MSRLLASHGITFRRDLSGIWKDRLQKYQTPSRAPQSRPALSGFRGAAAANKSGTYRFYGLYKLARLQQNVNKVIPALREVPAAKVPSSGKEPDA